MSERLNGLRMDEWVYQSAPRAKGREEETPATAGENPPMSDEKCPILREAARRGVEAKQQAAPATTPPAAAKAPRPAPFQKAKPPVVGVEQVAARCGHAVPFELFEPKKDKFRDDRRKKLTGRDCSACRVKAQAVKEAADKEAARLRRARKPKAEGRPAGPQERLPHGSRFDVSYDAAKEAWSGTLTVPGMAPVAASASAVFKLLRRLDEQYRAAAAGKPRDGADVNRDEGAGLNAPRPSAGAG